MQTQQEKELLRIKGADFIARESQRFIKKMINGKFVAEFISTTEPKLYGSYARVPAAFKKLHMETWTSPRGQEIIDSTPTQMYQWNFHSGWCVSEHPSMSLLLIWYNRCAQVIGLAGPTKPAVLSYAALENRLYSSRTLYTEREINNFNLTTEENVIYIQNFVHP